MKRTLTLSAIFFLFAVAVLVGCSQEGTNSTVNVDQGEASSKPKYLIFKDDDNVAVKGYDVVSYFTDEKPMPGTAEHTFDWHGATWQFASEENKSMFEADPEKYAPAYGGYCAWGVGAKNDLFEIDPERWKVVDGTLYLNFNADVQQQWLEDLPGFIKKADEYWPGLVEKNTK